MQSILYIDDDVGCLKVFLETFGDENDVRTVTTLSEARRMLMEQPADIVISDQSMPEITGADFLREVALNYPASYRVLLTGSIGLVGVMPEIGAGIIHFFAPKPWTKQDMGQMLERSIAHLGGPDKVR